MRVWTIPAFGIDKMEYSEVSIPQAGRGEVVVQVHACSLNFRDLMMVSGTYHPNLHFPRIPLSDGAGVIFSIGEGVTRWEKGDRVAGIFMPNWIDGTPSNAKYKGALGGEADGMAAQYVVLPEQALVHIPAYLSYEQAATLPCAAVTAWSALHKAMPITAGSSVLIQGTGGVSIFALQLAKAMGARVLGTSSSDEKLERAKALGLDAGVNYKSTPDWAKWVLEQTDGEGVDLVIEVGGASTYTQALKATKIGGAMAQIGALTQGQDPAPVVPMLYKQASWRGIHVGSRADFEAMNRALEVSQLQPVIDHVFAPEELPEALQTMQSAAHFGKLVVRMQA